jgi:TRAP-type C4-dicarboxylate transport system permease small subunit
MQPKQLLTWVARGLVTLLMAAALYIGLAFATLYLFSVLFEGSGHPPLPDAPENWYFFAFVVFCPLVALSLAVWIVTWVRRKVDERAAKRPPHAFP